MGDYLSDICVFGTGYKRAKDYLRAYFHASNTTMISKVKPTKEPGPCFKCGGPHFQNKCMKNNGHSNSRSQNYNKSNISQSFIEIIITAVSFLQVLHPSRHHSKLSQLMTFYCQHNKAFPE